MKTEVGKIALAVMIGSIVIIIEIETVDQGHAPKIGAEKVDPEMMKEGAVAVVAANARKRRRKK